MDYKLSEAQVLHYLHNLLNCEPKQIYRKKVVSVTNVYARAIAFSAQNNSCVSGQNCMSQYLLGLSLKGIMENELYDTGKVIKKLRRTIIRYGLLGPVSLCSEKAKVEYVYNTVAGFE